MNDFLSIRIGLNAPHGMIHPAPTNIRMMFEGATHIRRFFAIFINRAFFNNP